jgi:predicted PurR-regulated permease PerM
MNWGAFFGVIGAIVAMAAALCVHVWISTWIGDRVSEAAGATYFFGVIILTTATVVGLNA